MATLVVNAMVGAGRVVLIFSYYSNMKGRSGRPVGGCVGPGVGRVRVGVRGVVLGIFAMPPRVVVLARGRGGDGT